MIQDLLKQIKQPLDDYLSGKSAGKEVDWWNWKYQVSVARKKDFFAVREVLTPYYHRFFMADEDFFRNGNKDSQVRNTLIEVIEKEGNYAGRLFKELDIIKAAETWAERLLPDNHKPTYFFQLLLSLQKRDFTPDWDNIHDKLIYKIKRAKHYGNYKNQEMYCLLMGLTMIERTNLSREKKNELFMLMKTNWQFMKYMYSVLTNLFVGLRMDNFASVANTACTMKSAYPHMHLFYKAFKENFDKLCPKDQKDSHSGESVQEQAVVHLSRMEDIIKSTPPSNELEELCSILFTKVFKDVLRQSRPKTYEELENAVNDITKKYNEVLKQLTQAVMDIESDVISINELVDAFMLFPSQLAFSYYGSLSTLLAQNKTWHKHAPIIQMKILEKQKTEQSLIIQNQNNYNCPQFMSEVNNTDFIIQNQNGTV